MPLSDAGRNAMLSGGLGNTITHVSLHSGDPGTTGTAELTGGTPAYGRKAVTWNAAAAGVRDNAAQMDFDVPAGTTVFHVGYWTAITAGSFLGWFPVGGFLAFAAVQPASSDVFTSYAHGLNNDDRVVIYDVQQAGVPTGLVEGTVYWVVNKTADTFQLAASQGGAAINATTDAEVIAQRVLPEVFAGQGVYSVAANALKLNAQFVQAAAMAVDVQTYTPGAFTWNKPANALWVEMFAIGGGGGGGAGYKWNSGVAAYGGSGGGSAAWSRTLWPAADLPSSLAVACGQAGNTPGAQQRCTLDTGTPPLPVAAAQNSYGMRFTPTAHGFITHIRYWRETNFAHNLSLWDQTGARLGTALADVSTGSNGWREVALPAPIYVASGQRITVTRTQDNQARHDGPALSSAAANLGSLMGAYTSGTGDVYPTTDAGTTASANYNVDVVFQPLLTAGDSYVGASQDAAWVYASGGGNGVPGWSTLPAAGAAGAAGEWPGVAGAQSSISAAAGVGSGSDHTGAGGGGGGISAGGGSFAGGNGGNNFVAGWGHASAAGGAINNPGVAGDSLGSIAGGFGGSGGGAGGATGGKGGDGGLPGGGGGGGGSGTATAGAPGLGGQGRVIIVTYLSA